MTDYHPQRARGERGDLEAQAPPRPDEDERWEYVADHLRAIRASLAFLVFVTFVAVLLAAFAVMKSISDTGV